MPQATRNPVKSLRNAVIYRIKQDTYLGALLTNTVLAAPVVYQESIENLKHFNCPAIGVFYPLDMPFGDTTFGIDFKLMPNLFYIDVVVERPLFPDAQDAALDLALSVVETLLPLGLSGMPGSDGVNTCEDFRFDRISEIGVNPFQTNIFQFAYRIFFIAKYY